MTQEEEIAHLRAENQTLREALSQALARIEELEKQKTSPPEFVKANGKKPKAEGKKRARSVRQSTITGERVRCPHRSWSTAL